MTRSQRSRLASLVAATLVAAAGLVGLTSTPASAALCSGSGVNVVVDFGALGGGVQKGCDRGGAGKTGQQVFPAAGFGLSYDLQPGYVCRVSNKPKSGQTCQATDAYWGLFWSDGKSGKWNYATSGVGGQRASEGGFLAFAWQGSATKRQPATSPKNTTSTPTKTPVPTPTRTPTKKPTKTKTPKPAKTTKPNKTTATTAPTQQATPRAVAPVAPTRTPTPTPTPSTKRNPTATATASESTSAGTTPGPSSSAEAAAAVPEAADAQNASSALSPADEQSGLPPWIPVTVVLVLAVAALGGLWWRNRSSTT